MIRKMKVLDTSVRTFAVIGILVALNVIGFGIFGRLDLTKDKQFTLSEATTQTLSQLKDPITVRAYFTKDLPAPYSENARYVKDLLEEYYTHGHGHFRFEFIDPISEETSEDKEKKKNVRQDIFGREIREPTHIERELQNLGIEPVQIRVAEDDKFEVKRAYMGLAVRYGEKTEVMPVISETGTLEYDLTTLLRKVSRDKAPTVVLLGGHQGYDPKSQMAQVYGALSQLYDIQEIDLGTGGTIPEGTRAVLVVSPQTELSDAEKKSLDDFLVKGGSVAFLINDLIVDERTLEPRPIAHNLQSFLAGYGVKVGPGLVLDAECATITIQQQRGMIRFGQPVQYPFMPVPRKIDTSHPLTRGLTELSLPFMSPIEVESKTASVESHVLVRSSGKSWVVQPPYNTDPLQQWSPTIAQGEQGKPLIVALSGSFTSQYGNAPAEGGSKSRLLVSGGASFLSDPFLTQPNSALTLNILDWLVLDDSLLAIRTRGLDSAPFTEEVSDAKRNAIKYINLLGIPLLMIGYGLVRRSMRERRREAVVL